MVKTEQAYNISSQHFPSVFLMQPSRHLAFIVAEATADFCLTCCLKKMICLFSDLTVSFQPVLLNGVILSNVQGYWNWSYFCPPISLVSWKPFQCQSVLQCKSCPPFRDMLKVYFPSSCRPLMRMLNNIDLSINSEE